MLFYCALLLRARNYTATTKINIDFRSMFHTHMNCLLRVMSPMMNYICPKRYVFSYDIQENDIEGLIYRKAEK